MTETVTTTNGPTLAVGNRLPLDRGYLDRIVFWELAPIRRPAGPQLDRGYLDHLRSVGQ